MHNGKDMLGAIEVADTSLQPHTFARNLPGNTRSFTKKIGDHVLTVFVKIFWKMAHKFAKKVLFKFMGKTMQHRKLSYFTVIK